MHSSQEKLSENELQDSTKQIYIINPNPYIIPRTFDPIKLLIKGVRAYHSRSSSMADASGTRVLGDRRRSRDHLVEEFVPLSGWTEESNAHYLLVQLPGFGKEEVRLQVDSTGCLILRGERMVNESKGVYVEQAYKLPGDSDVDKITGKFVEDLLQITVPKLARLEEKEGESEHVENVSMSPGNGQEPPRETENLGRHDDGGYDYKQDHDNEMRGNQSKKTGHVDSFPKEFIRGLKACPMELLKKNKGIVLAIVVAFSLGVLLSRRFESTGQ